MLNMGEVVSTQLVTLQAIGDTQTLTGSVEPVEVVTTIATAKAVAIVVS